MNTRANMRPPPDRDFPMPPPSTSPSAQWQPSPNADRPVPLQHQQLTDKYSTLKRRYFSLDERQKDTHMELQRSMERNTKLRSERNILLDRIIELEERNKLFERHLTQLDPAFVSSHKDHPASTSGAFPRALLSQRAQTAFVANLQQAMHEVENEDPASAGDPVSAGVHSRYAGPAARKRQVEDTERRQEEEDRLQKRQRRPRGAPSVPSGGGGSAPLTSGRNGNGNGVSAIGNVPDAARQQPTAHAFTFAHDRSEPRGVSESRSGSGSGSRSPRPPPSSSSSFPRIAGPQSPQEDTRVRSPLEDSPTSPGTYYRTQRNFKFVGPNARTSITSGPTTTPLSKAPSEPVGTPMPPLSPRMEATTRQTMAPPSAPASGPPLPYPNALAPMPASAPPAVPSNINMAYSAPRPSELQRLTKPKRLKAHTVTSKSHSIPTVPRDRATGRPLLPLNVGIMTVVQLGEVCMREHFHTERYIFPVGYEVTRRYLSTQDPNAEVVYHCTILDGGDGPKFQILAADMPDKPIIAGTATGAWSGIVRAANLIRKRQHSNSVSGPDYFGLGQNTIKHLIQELPGADRLKNYVWQNFVEGGPLGGRHAAVIPALPEEYESSVVAGAYYTRDRERGLPMHLGDPATGLGISVMPEPLGSQNSEEYVEYEPDRERGWEKERDEYEYANRRRRSGSVSSTGSARQVSRRRREPSSRGEYAPSPPPSAQSQQSQHSLSSQSQSLSQSRSQTRSQQSGSSVPPTLASIMHAYAPPSAPLTAHAHAHSHSHAHPRHHSHAHSSYSPESAMAHG